MLPYHGQCGAGRSVIEFPQTVKVSKRLTPVPPHLTHLYKTLVSYDVSGESLEFDRIFDGDVLLCNAEFERDRLAPGKLCIVRLFNSEIVAKRVGFDAAGNLFLGCRDKAGKLNCTTYEPDQAEILAIVVGVYRDAI